jgi:hypothetical protein
MGGRDQEMTFGIGTINFGAFYDAANERTISASTASVDGPNKGAKFHLANLPSDAVVVKEYGKAEATGLGKAADLTANKTYVVVIL